MIEILSNFHRHISEHAEVVQILGFNIEAYFRLLCPTLFLRYFALLGSIRHITSVFFFFFNSPILHTIRQTQSFLRHTSIVQQLCESLEWFDPRGEPRLELGVHRLWNYVELFWNSLDNAPSSIVFYLK